MNNLPDLPNPPHGVKYALTVPQSVLFADLSLRGSQRHVFRRVFNIAYEPSFIAIDDGAMSWDFTVDDPFVRELSPELDISGTVVPRFLEAMGRTSRTLIRTAIIVSKSSRRRTAHLAEDISADLNSYWDAYESHMASLFTFWNVETVLTDELISALRRDGRNDEVDSGLPTFIVPSESNWFALEQSNLATLQARFGATPSPDSLHAAADHRDVFGFLLAPFNLGSPPSAESVLERMSTLKVTSAQRSSPVSLANFAADVRHLGQLERELTFWKTERLDTFALADQIVRPLYEQAAEHLKIAYASLFAMRRQEIDDSLQGRPIDYVAASARAARYCLALIDGRIQFYKPTVKSTVDTDVAASGDVLHGSPASPGTVRGRVRLVVPGEVPALYPDEILVTQMTRPDMGAALDVALAYVTDEGGRLSHAAIVSREKGKPCVVGVGNATHVLRPGMMIEVDGSQGTVTVIDASFLDERP